MSNARRDLFATKWICRSRCVGWPRLLASTGVSVLHLLTPLIFAFAVVTAKVDSTELRREGLMAALRTGGYTVLLCDVRTDRSFQKQINPMPSASP